MDSEITTFIWRYLQLCSDSNSQSLWGKSVQGSNVSLKGYYGFNKRQEGLNLLNYSTNESSPAGLHSVST